MKTIDTLIIGAGQAGLALSRGLTDRGVDHVVLERGRVAQRWRERWESLRLLSPNWMTRLPGFSYRGPDPDGFMSRDDVIRFLDSYARSFGAPIEEQTEVLLVDRWADDWRVITNRGRWLARNLVIATGHCDRPNVPAMAKNLPADIVQVPTLDYRGPEQFPRKAVLVVGASSSGLQLADEIHRSGRRVILSVGEHNRLPRRYRGRDIFYWLDRIGTFRKPLEEMPSLQSARHEPSLQLTGRPYGESLDLGVLARQGVRLAGRLSSIEGSLLRFDDDLAQTNARSDERMRRLLARIDEYIATRRSEHSAPEATPMDSVPVEGAPLDLDLRLSHIGGVLWATGYKRSYPWLQAPVFDEHGEIRQLRGRTPARGLYILGIQFMVRRNSSLIDGVGRDAEEIAAEIARGPRKSLRTEEAA